MRKYNIKWELKQRKNETEREKVEKRKKEKK